MKPATVRLISPEYAECAAPACARSGRQPGCRDKNGVPGVRNNLHLAVFAQSVNPRLLVKAASFLR